MMNIKGEKDFIENNDTDKEIKETKSKKRKHLDIIVKKEIYMRIS